MYKQLGSSPSINPYSQNQDTEEKDKSDKNSPNSSLETRAHATKRAKGHNNSRSQQIINEVQEEPLELTVQKSTSSEKAKQSKKQPKTAPILQQKKLQQGNPDTSKVSASNNSKRNNKSKSNKSKSNLKKPKEKSVVTCDVTDGRRPRRGAAIAASAAMMAQKVLDKQLSSANVAFSDESSSDEEVEEDEIEEGPTNAETETGRNSMSILISIFNIKYTVKSLRSYERNKLFLLQKMNQQLKREHKTRVKRHQLQRNSLHLKTNSPVALKSL